MKKLFLYTVLCLSFLPLPATSYAADEVTFGVVAPRGALDAKKKWTELVNYLSEKTGTTIKPVYKNPKAITEEFKAGNLDFMMNNPAMAAVATESMGAEALASLNKNSGNKFAGVIISKKGSGIEKGEDVKGKKIMSFKVGKSAGAYVFQKYHLLQKGVNIDTDGEWLKDAKTQDNVVLAVVNGAADVGLIRSGILENMAKAGKINLDDITVIDQQESELKQLHSTALYPEWYVVAKEGTDGKAFKDALLSVTADSPAAEKAKIKGFTEPTPIENMVNVLKELKIPPFDK